MPARAENRIAGVFQDTMVPQLWKAIDPKFISGMWDTYRSKYRL